MLLLQLNGEFGARDVRPTELKPTIKSFAPNLDCHRARIKASRLVRGEELNRAGADNTHL